MYENPNETGKKKTHAVGLGVRVIMFLSKFIKFLERITLHLEGIPMGFVIN